MKKQKKIQITPEWIDVNLIKEKKSIKECSEMLNCHIATFYRYLIALGYNVKNLNKKEKIPKYLNKEKIKRHVRQSKLKRQEINISDLYQAYAIEKHSLVKCSKLFNRSINTIKKLLLKHQIPVRNMKEIASDPIWQKNRIDQIKGERNCCFGKKGKDHPAYKEVKITPLYKLIRTIPQYKVWRQSVFERDQWTCQICKKQGGDLNADHVLQLAKILKIYNILSIEEAIKNEHLWNISNGLTLCIECHRKTETYGKQIK